MEGNASDENKNKKKEDLKSTDDLEMGDDEVNEQTPAEQKPKVNNYMNDIKKPQKAAQTSQPKVDPSAEAPKAAPAQNNVPVEKDIEPRPQPKPGMQGAQTIGQARTSIQKPIVSTTRKPVNPAAKKKAVLGCFGAFAAIVAILLILSFIFIGQGAEETANPIAQLLGIEQGIFINSLITLINGLFIVMALVAFVVTMAGFFKTATAKRGDKETKKKGIRTGIISLVFLTVILIVWMFVFVYLDSKRVDVTGEIKAPIITTPEETLNLSAPVEIRFDASNVPIDSRKFQIIAYDWDFGDGDTGTSQIVAHKYEDKGRFDVVLSITKKNKSSGEETVDEYSVTVSIENQALKASFTADPPSGEAPLKVTFDASESVDPDGEIDRYEWDFDEDGEFGDKEGKEVTYEFEKVGEYKVSLRVVSATGEYDITEQPIIVTEQAVPQAVIEVVNEPDVYETGTDYIFRADEASSAGGDIVDYMWDFGDGAPEVEGKTKSHTYDKEGTFEIILTLTDEAGEEGEVRKSITIGTAQASPTAKISTTPQNLIGPAPLAVSFDASGSSDPDNNIVDYSWDFDGDGVDDAFGSTASYSYTEEGTYTASLTVEDADGNTDSASVSIQVETQGITAALKADKIDGNVPLTVSFDASGSSYPGEQITSYTWDFGDGTSPKVGSATISHKFDSIGTFPVTVTITGSDNSQDSTQINVTVREVALTACFKPVFYSGLAPLNNTFDPSCSTGTISTYFWDFGDGGTSSTVKPSHLFEAPGEYTVTLELTDADNTVSTSSIKITVTE